MAQTIRAGRNAEAVDRAVRPWTRRILGLAPGLEVLLRYERGWLRADVLAGLTVGAMVIPQSMAYAGLAGLPPESGLYAAVAALVVYALVGSSRHLGTGPEPGTAILAATGVGALAAGDPGRYAVLMAELALVTAAICVAAAILRLGFVGSLLSKPVLVGYTTGVGLALLGSQLGPVTGVDFESDRLLPRAWELLADIEDVQGPTLAVATATLALVLALRRVAPLTPGGLIGVILATAAAVAFGLDDVAVIGDIPAGLPAPQIPDVGLVDFGQLLPIAAGIALVGFTDNLLTARSVAGRDRVEANRELLALGWVNLFAGLSRGFPVSSSASRTAVASSMQSKTQLVSLVAAASIIATLQALHPLLAEVPIPALAAVIVAAALTIVDVKGFRSLWRISRSETATAAAAVTGVVLFDVLAGVVVAVVSSGLLALYRVARPHDAVLGDAPDVDGWVDVDVHLAATTEPGLLVYRFDAPVFFVNADYFCERVERVLDKNPGAEEWLVLDFGAVGSLDATAVDALAGLVDRLSVRSVAVLAVARANAAVIERLEAAGLLAPGGGLREFPTINSAVRAFRQRNGSA